MVGTVREGEWAWLLLEKGFLFTQLVETIYNFFIFLWCNNARPPPSFDRGLTETVAPRLAYRIFFFFFVREKQILP